MQHKPKLIFDNPLTSVNKFLTADVADVAESTLLSTEAKPLMRQKTLSCGCSPRRGFLKDVQPAASGLLI